MNHPVVRLFVSAVMAMSALSACAPPLIVGDSAADASAADAVADRAGDAERDAASMLDASDDRALDVASAADALEASALDSGEDAGCARGQRSCADRCVDTQTDALNCGACGAACPMGHLCVAGACRIECALPRTRCSTSGAMSCVDTQSDPLNCGACGASCTIANGVASCVSAACAVASCTGTFADCDSMASNGCERDTSSSVAHCGGCGRACAALANATVACTAGSCAIGACSAGFADCDRAATNGCEVALNTVSNCGACGTVCPARANATPSCAMMTCASVCNAGFENCDGDATNGCEANLGTNPNHCGACGVACAAGRICRSGTCAAANRVLISDGYGSADLRGYLTGWGYTVTVVPGATLNSTFDYAPYDIVAFMFDSTIADPARLIAQNVAGRVGIVLHRSDALVGTFGMGGSGFWQMGAFSVSDASHYVTSPFSVGPLDLFYTYKSILNAPAVGTRVLGTSTSPSLVVHNTYRRIVTPYYGHTAGMPWSTAGATLTRRSYEWAAGSGAQ